MPASHDDLRGDVLRAARESGWRHSTERTTHGAISDEFQHGSTTLTLFWTATPWCDARMHGGFVTVGAEQRNVWGIKGDNQALAILKSP